MGDGAKSDKEALHCLRSKGLAGLGLVELNGFNALPVSVPATQCSEPHAMLMTFLPCSAVTRRGLLT